MPTPAATDRLPGGLSPHAIVLLPHDPGYDPARLLLNRTYDPRPAVIVTAFDARARRKHDLLWRRAWDNPGCADAGVTETELWQWFLGECLGRPVPPDTEAWAVDHDLGDRDLMRRTALREWIYRRMTLDLSLGDRPAPSRVTLGAP